MLTTKKYSSIISTYQQKQHKKQKNKKLQKSVDIQKNVWYHEFKIKQGQDKLLNFFESNPCLT